MALDNAKNFAKVTVSTGYNSAATSVVLTAGHGARLPTVPFNAVWYNATDYSDPADDPSVEIVRVTTIATDTLTVTRAQESSSASNKNTAAKTYKMIAGLTAKVINTDLAANQLAINGHYLTDGANFFVPPSLYQAVTPDNLTFAWNNQNSASEAASGKSLILSCAAGSDQMRIREIARGSNTTLEIAIAVDLDRSNAFAGLCVRDSVGGKVIAWARKDNSLYIFKYTNATAFSSTAVNFGSLFLSNVLFMRFRITGGNIFFDISSLGEKWKNMFTETSTTFFANAPDTWGYCLNPGGSGQGGDNTLLSFKQS